MLQSPISCQLIFHINQVKLGRRRLAARTGLSEMTVRLELQRLRKQGVVNLPRAGVELTPTGRARFSLLLGRVRAARELNLVRLRLDDVATAALVVVEGEVPAWKQRDLAIREGASGLLLLRRGGRGWCFVESGEPVALHNPADAATLETAFSAACIDDRLIIAFGSDRRSAGVGLWRVVGNMTGIS